MFARTRRLTLRPAWPEEALALAAIGHDEMIDQVAPACSAQNKADGAAGDIGAIAFLICAHEGAAPRLIGSIALVPRAGAHELRFWLTADARGRGYATEAALAVIAMAKHALPIARLTAVSSLDNAASTGVLRKLGFRDIDDCDTRSSPAHVRSPGAMIVELDVGDQLPFLPIAA